MSKGTNPNSIKRIHFLFTRYVKQVLQVSVLQDVVFILGIPIYLLQTIRQTSGDLKYHNRKCRLFLSVEKYPGQVFRYAGQDSCSIIFAAKFLLPENAVQAMKKVK